jgi:hypothetical protein
MKNKYLYKYTEDMPTSPVKYLEINIFVKIFPLNKSSWKKSKKTCYGL